MVATLADGSQQVVTVPTLLHDSAPLTLTVTSANPAVAVPNGAAGGTATLTFAEGGPRHPDGHHLAHRPRCDDLLPELGPAELRGRDPRRRSGGEIPIVLLSDDFNGAAIDEAKWRRDEVPFDTGTFKADLSDITLSSGQVKINVEAETPNWPGLALYTQKTFDVKQTEPAIFEIDRAKLGFVLVNGTGARQHAGIWVRDGNGNFVFFADSEAHNGNNYGWRYNKSTGNPDTDNPTDEGTNIAAFDGGTFDNAGNHRMKLTANGVTVKLYLDGVFGAEVHFPFKDGLSFGFGTYVRAANDIATGYFDNAVVMGGSAPISVGKFNSTAFQDGNVVISWTGGGVLQSSDSLTAPNWNDVTPAPVGTSLTVPAGSQAANRFYRLRL